MDGQNVLTNNTDYAASVVSTVINKKLTEIRAMMKQLVALVTAQAETVTALSTKINSDGSGSGYTTNKKKLRPELHVCVHCKQEVYHKYRNCLELEANNSKRYPGRKIIFTKE